MEEVPITTAAWLGLASPALPSRSWNTSRFRHLVIEIGDNRLSRFCFAHLQDCIVMCSLIMGFTMRSRPLGRIPPAHPHSNNNNNKNKNKNNNNVPPSPPTPTRKHPFVAHFSQYTLHYVAAAIVAPLQNQTSVAFESCSVHWSGEIFGHGWSRSEGFPSATGGWVGWLCVVVFQFRFASFCFVLIHFEVYAAMDSYRMIGAILNFNRWFLRLVPRPHQTFRSVLAVKTVGEYV